MIRAFDPERQGRWSFSPQQATLRRPDKAFQVFFQRVKAGQTPGHPRFKGVGHHKTALGPVRDHDVIGHEKLNTAGMTKTSAPKPDPDPDPDSEGAFLPNGAAARAGWNESILEVGWAQLLSILAQKAGSAARRVIAVAARDTSRTCPLAAGGCGQVAKENRVTQAEFECVKCGLAENADTVGALNVLHRAGLAHCAEAWPPTQETRASTHGWSHGGDSHRVSGRSGRKAVRAVPVSPGRDGRGPARALCRLRPAGPGRR